MADGAREVGRVLLTAARATAVVVALGLVASLGLTSCSKRDKADVTVVENEYTIEVFPNTIAKSTAKVVIRNQGALTHELVAFRTDLDETKLPIASDHIRVDETSQFVTRVGPITTVPAHSTTTITLSLGPGRYVLVCNLPLHYAKGMHVVLNVTGSN